MEDLENKLMSIKHGWNASGKDNYESGIYLNVCACVRMCMCKLLSAYMLCLCEYVCTCVNVCVRVCVCICVCMCVLSLMFMQMYEAVWHMSVYVFACAQEIKITSLPRIFQRRYSFILIERSRK